MNVVVGSLKAFQESFVLGMLALNSIPCRLWRLLCSLRTVLKHLIFTNFYGHQVSYMVSTGDWDTDQVSSLVAS